MDKVYCTYILSNKTNSTLYVGVTSDLEKRMYQHKKQISSGFTKKYNLSKLVYFEFGNNIETAIKREKLLKSWKRQWKIDLINESNPDWNDLSNMWW